MERVDRRIDGSAGRSFEVDHLLIMGTLSFVCLRNIVDLILLEIPIVLAWLHHRKMELFACGM